MRHLIIALSILVAGVSSAVAQLSIGIGLPGVSIGINLPLYPELVRVPNYPVYYAPRLQANFFFFDGMYWVFQGDNWYASTWYNGPWGLVAPELVPLFILRIPVRYYRNPPVYFGGWHADAPPRWGEHWGHDWERQRDGWDRWNRRSTPAPAPLPVYQRRYSGEQYPRPEQQRALEGRNYRYQPRDPVVQQHFRQQAVPRSPTSSNQGAERRRSPALQQERMPPPPRAAPQDRPAARPDQRGVPQARGAPPEPHRGQGQERQREKDDERGQQRNRP